MSITLMLTGFVISNSCLAITNIEDERIKAEKNGWSGQLEFSIDGKSGNTHNQTFSADAKTVYHQDRYTSLLIIGKEYGKDFHQKNANNSFAHARSIQERTARFATEQYIQYQDDEFRLLDSRTLLGAGIRYQLNEESKTLVWFLGAGAYYTEEKWDLPDSSTAENDREDDYARASIYSSYKHQLSDNVFLLDTLYWQPRLSQPADFYIYNQLAIKVKINGALAFKLSLESNHDSKPINQLRHTDHSYYSSLIYSF